MKDRTRLIAASIIALSIGLVAFIFRFNTLGGALGGFDNDHFIYLIRTDMLLGGEQPLRDFADAELRGAWPALTYAISAWAQQLGGRTLLPEAFLTAGGLAAASAGVFLIALRLSARWSAAVLAAATTVVMSPKLYNYPKVLMLALAAWALIAAVREPSLTRLTILALITVVAALFRHDLGLYIGVATIVALGVRHAGEWRATGRAMAAYAALTLLFTVPPLVSVQVYEGIPSYIQHSLTSVAAERARTPLVLSPLDVRAPFSGESLLHVTYYAFWAVPVLAALAWLAEVVVPSAPPLSAPDRAAGAGLFTLAVLANMSFLRANLAERFGDAAVPVVLMAAWIVGRAVGWRSPVARAVLTVVPVVLIAQMFTAAYAFSDVRRELDTSGLSDSWDKVARRYTSVKRELSALPPQHWDGPETESGILSAARYIATCTGPDDRILVVGPTHEILVLAGRKFAAGQPLFKLSMYTSDQDQRRAIARLDAQSVPVLVASAREFGDSLLEDYPLVARYLAGRFRDVGSIEVDEESRVRVFVDASRNPVRMDARLGLPCFR